jgi:hypothetical protein
MDYDAKNDYPEYEPPIIHNRRKYDDSPMKFDTTINIGNVISFVALIITILIAYNGIVSRMINMENKVDLMWSKFAIELRKE